MTILKLIVLVIYLIYYLCENVHDQCMHIFENFDICVHMCTYINLYIHIQILQYAYHIRTYTRITNIAHRMFVHKSIYTSLELCMYEYCNILWQNLNVNIFCCHSILWGNIENSILWYQGYDFLHRFVTLNINNEFSSIPKARLDSNRIGFCYNLNTYISRWLLLILLITLCKTSCLKPGC